MIDQSGPGISAAWQKWALREVTGKKEGGYSLDTVKKSKRS
jgi:hypothetical protein